MVQLARTRGIRDPEDLVQHVFRSLLVSKTPAMDIAYVNKRLLSRGVSYLQRQSRQQEHLVPLSDEVSDTVGAVDDQFAAAEISEEITQVLHALTPEHRQVLTWFYLEEKSLMEICRLLRCTSSAVKSLLHRARAKARVELMRLRELPPYQRNLSSRARG